MNDKRQYTVINSNRAKDFLFNARAEMDQMNNGIFNQQQLIAQQMQQEKLKSDEMFRSQQDNNHQMNLELLKKTL